MLTLAQRGVLCVPLDLGWEKRAHPDILDREFWHAGPLIWGSHSIAESSAP